MISLRKHLDAYRKEEEPGLTAFRASLVAMAQSRQRAIPALGPDLSRNLTRIHESVNRATPDQLNTATRALEQELSVWADRALCQSQENEREMKEIVGAVASAAESVSKRDEKYSGRIRELTGKLKTIAELSDLSSIRRSIVESAAALRTCVEQMAEESRNSVIQLSQQVEEYREKLRETEKISGQDSLTGLPNRRAFEQQLETRMAGRCIFTLIMVDLDGFKVVNDRYGHLAGDALLKQFSVELKAQFPADDLVARWGGDEFAVLVFGDIRQAESHAGKVRKWALGTYKITTTEGPAKVPIGASIGIAQWNGQESGAELLARADTAVYAAKARQPHQPI